MATASHAAGLTDTDILIDAARGVANAGAFLSDQQTRGAIRISVISAMELVAGCRNAAELIAVQGFLSGVSVASVTEPASQLARQLMETYFLSHGLLIADALIAATALELQTPLYSKNTRHFQMIRGLVVTRPY